MNAWKILRLFEKYYDRIISITGISRYIHLLSFSDVVQESGQKLSFELKIILTLTVKHVSFRIMVIDNNVKD